MNLREAAQMALEALMVWERMHPTTTASATRNPSIIALSQALAQPEWVGLTEDEFEKILEKHNEATPFAVYLNIEAKLKEKNG